MTKVVLLLIAVVMLTGCSSFGFNHKTPQEGYQIVTITTVKHEKVEE